jgi:hypothetical protein
METAKAQVSYNGWETGQNATGSDPGPGIAAIPRGRLEAGFCAAKSRLRPGVEPLAKTNSICNYLNFKERHEFVADPYRHF